MARFVAAACFLCLLALGAEAAEESPGRPDAGEWTRFRGPNGSGIGEAPRLPAQWTEKDYRWKVALPGAGHSSPVLWGRRTFVTCGDEKSAQRVVLCLDAADGHVLWRRDYESKRFQKNPSNSYAAATPTVDRDRVYVTWSTPEEITLLALDHGGKDVWRRDLGPFKSEHGSGTSPILVGDLLILGNDQEGKSSLIAVDRRTGETKWEIARRTTKASYATPLLYQPEGREGEAPAEPPQLIFTSTSHGFTSVDPKTGKTNWELADALPERCVGSPTLAGGLIVATCGTGGVARHLIAIRPGSKASGTEPKVAYLVKKGAPYVPTPLAKGDLLFLWGDAGVVSCVRAATGELVWQERVGSSFYGSPVCIGDRLYCMSRQGDCFVVAAGEKFQLLARNPLGEGSHATPAVAGGVLYLRTFSHLIAIGPK